MRVHTVRRVVVVGVLGVAGMLACSGDDNGVGPETPPAAVTIVMRDAAFAPQVDTVAVGGTVTWRNEDPFEHNTIADGGAWESDNFGEDEKFEHTFSAAGTYPYHCSLHEGMTGTIVVR